MAKYRFIVEKTKTGYSAFENDRSIFSTGKSMHELQINCLEGTNLYLEEYGESTAMNNLCFELDFKQFFSYYKVINAKHLASRIKMNPSLLSQYVNGKKKPSKKQVVRIVDGLHEIGRELVELTLV